MAFEPSYEVPAERRAFSVDADSSVGCLLIHGFMGSPNSWRPLAQQFQSYGISSLAPLLPGHGNFPSKLHKVPQKAWIAEAEEAFEMLSSRCDELFIIGHSMGGVLGAHLLSKYRGRASGIMLIAPPYKLPDPRLRYSWLIRYLVPWFSPWKRKSLKKLARERVLDFDPTLDIDDPELQPWLTEVTRFPMSAIDEMRKTTFLGRSLWPRIDLPTLIVQGGKDVATSPDNAQAILDLIPVADKDFAFFPEAGHELMRSKSPYAPEVWQRLYAFMRQHARNELPKPQSISAG